MLPWVFDINFECVSLCYGGFRRKSSWKKCDKKSSFYVIVNVKKNSNIFKEINLWWGGYISRKWDINRVSDLSPSIFMGRIYFTCKFRENCNKIYFKNSLFLFFLHYARFYSLSLFLLNRTYSPVSESLSVLRVVAVAQLLPPSLSLFPTPIIKSVTFCQN